MYNNKFYKYLAIIIKYHIWWFILGLLFLQLECIPEFLTHDFNEQLIENVQSKKAKNIYMFFFIHFIIPK